MNNKKTLDQRAIEIIIFVICDHFHVEPADLKVTNTPDFMFIRKIAAHILYEHYGLSGARTARLLGCGHPTNISAMNSRIMDMVRNESAKDGSVRETTKLIDMLCKKIEAKLHPQPLIISPKSTHPGQDSPPEHNATTSANDLMGIAVRVCPPILRKAPPLANAGISPLEVSKRIAVYIAWKDQRKKVAVLSNEFGIESEDVLSAIGFVEYFGSDGLSAEIRKMLAGVRSQVTSLP